MTEPAVPATGDGGLVRLRLDLAYDGTTFSGWAVQPGRRTVQGEVQAALATVLRLPAVQVTCAGRTDAGVHARGQVVHVDLPEAAVGAAGAVGAVGAVGESVGDHLVRLGRRLAGVLPGDLAVRDVRLAPPGFDARFSPLWRRYAYRVSDSPYGPDPLRRHEVLAHHRPLDGAAMDAAARTLRGEHDFAAFCRRREGATTVRELLEFAWERADDLLVATVVADAFCHSMVRALVGACLAVGEGRRPVDWPARVLAGRERVPDVPVVAAHGLTLEEVRYPADDELGTRAERTRRVRGALA